MVPQSTQLLGLKLGIFLYFSFLTTKADELQISPSLTVLIHYSLGHSLPTLTLLSPDTPPTQPPGDLLKM